MDIDLTNTSEELIKNLNDRIEEIERMLNDDEYFCNQDINATYEIAENFLKKFQIKFSEKLNELKIKLHHIREENFNLSKQNKKQFDDEIEQINQLYTSGKHQEAIEKLNIYEKDFSQRTLIQNIPKLYMKDIDINQYFSIDKPLITHQISLDKIKPNIIKNEQELIKPYFDIRLRNSDQQQTLINNNQINKEQKSPIIPTSPRPISFSTRLSSSSSKSLSLSERDIVTPISISYSKQNSRENIELTPPSPMVFSPIQRQISTTKISKGESLIPTFITNYQHERNATFLMTCNETSIILLRSQSNQLDRWHSTIITRFNPTQKYSKSHDLSIKSLGFIDKNNIYIFTGHKFLKYSSDLSTELYSCILLLTDNNPNDISNNFHGIIYDKYIYCIYINMKSHWILSIFELETKKHQCDQDLTEIFPDVKCFIDICITDRRINFLVQMDSLQYAVLFCSINIYLKIELNRLIHLSYGQAPLKICPIYISYTKKYLFFINDPSVKVIHILTNEKYLKSFPIIAYDLCYVEQNQELILTTNDGIYSININEQQKFFSELY